MKELSQKLERLIETAVEKEEIAGANIVVIRDGQEMAFAAGGYADIEAGKKYERDTIARLYSMTYLSFTQAILLNPSPLRLQTPGSLQHFRHLLHLFFHAAVWRSLCSLLFYYL